MKYFAIPTAVLALLLGLSLWNASAVEADVEPWCAALTEAVGAAERADWEAALRTLRETQSAWHARHPYFHIVTAHDELDKADAIFVRAEGFASSKEFAEFRAEASELIVQLRIIVEMQKLTVRNVL